MLTKGFITALPEYGDNIYKVRLPIFEQAGITKNKVTTSEFSATLSHDPGTLHAYKEGDCVYVGFEDNNYSNAVIIGLLDVNDDREATTFSLLNSLKVTETVDLPASTSIGGTNFNDILLQLNQLSFKQDKLPTPILNNYLHISSEGKLEWAPASGAGTGNVDSVSVNGGQHFGPDQNKNVNLVIKITDLIVPEEGSEYIDLVGQTDPYWGNIQGTITDQADLVNYITSRLPTALSQLTNDTGFIINTVNNLVNYYKKTETYTQQEVNDLIAQAASLKIKKVDDISEVDAPGYIYLVPASESGEDDYYDEYIYDEDTGQPERIGSTRLHLSKIGETGLLSDAIVPESGSEFIDLIGQRDPDWGNIQGDITNQTDLIQYIDTHGGSIKSITINNITYSPESGSTNVDLGDYVTESGMEAYVESYHDNTKVDKEPGKGLSTNDYTTAEKNKLSEIESGAEVNVQSDWNVTDSTSDAFIKNKPSIPAAQVNSDWNASSGVAEILNKPTVGNATITIHQDGVATDQTFDLDDTTNKTINLINTNTTYTLESGSSANIVKLTPSIGSASTVTVNNVAHAISADSATNATAATTAANASKLNNQDPSYYLNYYNLSNKPTIPDSLDDLNVPESGNEFIDLIGTYTRTSQLFNDGESGESPYATQEWVRENSGGVKSVATGTGLTGGPITESGTISLATAYGDSINPYGSKTTNYVLAAPNGSAGTPSFRALVKADLPSLSASDVGALPDSTSYVVSASVSGSTLTITPSTGNAVTFSDTTYESKAAAQGGNDVSLVTTGEKYTWNNKQDALPTAIKDRYLHTNASSGVLEWAVASSDNQTVKTSNVIFSANDAIQITAGSNITVTGDATAKTITIAGTADTGATSVETTGSGNAVTAASYNSSTRKLTLTKGTTFLTSHQSIKSLDTTATTAQTPSSTENIAGSGTINLHKVSKTGSYNDLLDKPTIPTVNNGTLSIQGNGAVASTFTANQSGNTTLNIKGSGGTTVTRSADNEITISTGSIPTVNNATLTIQKNGTTVNTFTANASSNVTANITVPVKVNDLVVQESGSEFIDLISTPNIPPCPTNVSGTFTLRATVSNGSVTYSWVSSN